MASLVDDTLGLQIYYHTVLIVLDVSSLSSPNDTYSATPMAVLSLDSQTNSVNKKYRYSMKCQYRLTLLDEEGEASYHTTELNRFVLLRLVAVYSRHCEHFECCQV